ncbi:MAG: hypothetical protein K2O70_10630, partial [Desulfovibrionaceae bacterium]|nr:hypothetical protein [Desulfovibrionaceae bacterium]
MKSHTLYISLIIAALSLLPAAVAGAEGYDGPYRNPAGKTPPGLERQGKVPPGQAKRYDDGRYHPDRRYDDGKYRPDRRYDDGRYHPGKKRDDGWRRRDDDPRRRHGDRYDRERRNPRYDRDGRKDCNRRHDRG